MLTAHPTEVQRKSILDAERDIAQLLTERDEIKRASAPSPAKDALTPRELADNESADARARASQLWQTRLLRFSKLTVADEIENALSYYEATFLREIPRVYADLEAGAGPAAPIAPLPAHGPVDRRRPRRQPQRHAPKRSSTRCAARPKLALRHYLTEVHYLGGELSLSATLVDVSVEMQALAERSPDTSEHRAGRALPPRPDRHLLAPGGHAAASSPAARPRAMRSPPQNPYPQAEEFLADLRTIEESLARRSTAPRWSRSACTR